MMIDALDDDDDGDVADANYDDDDDDDDDDAHSSSVHRDAPITQIANDIQSATYIRVVFQ